MKKLRKILSAVLTLAMLLSLAPMVMAEEQAAPALAVEPTPEQIFCGMLECTADESGYLEAQRYWSRVNRKDSFLAASILDYINEDGTFTTLLTNEIEAEIKTAIDAGEITEEDLAGVEIPDNIYDMFYMEIEAVYEVINGLLSMFEEYGQEEGIAVFEAFSADFPDAKAFYDKVIADCFDGVERPAMRNVVSFLMGTEMKLIEGDVMSKYDYLYAEDRELGYISDYMAPNGAYLNSGDIDNGTPEGNPSGARNVYKHLESKLNLGSINYKQALAILSGYSSDINGDLYSTVPVYNYFYNENGRRITDSFDLVNEDGTVLDTGLSVKDYAIEKMVQQYENGYSVEYKDIPMGEFELFFEELLAKYIPADLPTEDDVIPEGVDYREYISAEIEMYIADWKEMGDSDEMIWDGILWIYGGITYDSYGYIAESVEYGYARDAEGNKINIDDVMTVDGNLIMGERKGENVLAILAEYVKTMDTSAHLKGDVTDDGKVNLSDVSAMLKKVAGWDVEVPEDAADANGDGGVNLSDVSLTLQYIAGWDVAMIY